MARTRVRWGRVAALGATAVLGAGLLAGTAVGSTGAERPAHRIYVVRSGDTVWDLAVRVAGSGDPRPVVDRLIQLNSLHDAAVYPGQHLVLP